MLHLKTGIVFILWYLVLTGLLYLSFTIKKFFKGVKK